MRILLIDHNDSFTRNLEHLLAAATGRPPVICPWERATSLHSTAWDLLVLSPGPGAPADYGDQSELLEVGTPVLGVCLGMQLINHHYGGSIAPLPDCVHGKTEVISFAGQPRTVARYHSLYCDRVAAALTVLASNSAGVPMALAHRTRAVMGYQFHPESFLTVDGQYFIHYALSHLGLADR